MYQGTVRRHERTNDQRRPIDAATSRKINVSDGSKRWGVVLPWAPSGGRDEELAKRNENVSFETESFATLRDSPPPKGAQCLFDVCCGGGGLFPRLNFVRGGESGAGEARRSSRDEGQTQQPRHHTTVKHREEVPQEEQQ